MIVGISIDKVVLADLKAIVLTDDGFANSVEMDSNEKENLEELIKEHIEKLSSLLKGKIKPYSYKNKVSSKRKKKSLIEEEEEEEE